MVYVVWKGRDTGLFKTWSEVEPLVKGYKGAKFKKFDDDKEGEKAFKKGYENLDNFDVLQKIKQESKDAESFLPSSLYCESVYDNNNSILNIKLMDVESGLIVKEKNIHVFLCSYNMGQFIGLCEGISFIFSNGGYKNLYSNATPAIYWAREKRVGSSYKHDDNIGKLIDFGLATLEVLEDDGEQIRFLKTPGVLKKEVKLN